MSQPDGVIVYSTEEESVVQKEGENPKKKLVNVEFFNEAVKIVTEIDCEAFKVDKNKQKYGEEENRLHLLPRFKFKKQNKP